MAEIALLDQSTIDKIAAGEVVERPSSVVKELVENSMDAGASAVTVEIQEGGISLIRITDNGCGIPKDQVSLAFLRHSTSKIKSVEDLLNVSSLGFRGEALSSIAAVAQVELITKTIPDFTGVRYVIEGSEKKEKEEIGAPDGTTIVVRNLFYNTPVRRKFLKSAQTEAGYVCTLVERLALSRPDVSFKLIVNRQTKLHTSGNSNAKDVIYQIYGREMTSALLPLEEKNEWFSVSGFIGEPAVSRGNRNFENYFVNRRYVKSSLIAKSLEDAYKSFLMQHQYPFCVLYFTFAGTSLDVNVHPAKMELRFFGQEEIYRRLSACIRELLMNREHIKSASLDSAAAKKRVKATPEKRKDFPEPFEKKRLAQLKEAVREDSPYEPKYPKGAPVPDITAKNRTAEIQPAAAEKIRQDLPDPKAECNAASRRQAAPDKVRQDLPDPKAECNAAMLRQAAPDKPADTAPNYVQEELTYEGKFLSELARSRHKIIGQLFDTYWLVEYGEKLFIIDQHAAHEKVLYEKTLRSFQEKDFTTQLLSPPMIITLDNQEEQALKALLPQLKTFGFEIEPFGGREYAVCGVPGNLFGLDNRQVLLELLDSYEDIKKAAAPNLALEKIASMSCKAAVKGSHVLSVQEADRLISELLKLQNPYFCPHGRPTVISMSKYEIEKKFKRIV